MKIVLTPEAEKRRQALIASFKDPYLRKQLTLLSEGKMYGYTSLKQPVYSQTWHILYHLSDSDWNEEKKTLYGVVFYCMSNNEHRFTKNTGFAFWKLKRWLASSKYLFKIKL